MDGKDVGNLERYLTSLMVINDSWLNIPSFQSTASLHFRSMSDMTNSIAFGFLKGNDFESLNVSSVSNRSSPSEFTLSEYPEFETKQREIFF